MITNTSSSYIQGDELTRTLSQEEAEDEQEAITFHVDQDDTNTIVTFEPFEPGNIWTQKQPTQFQRKQWRKRVYLEEEGDDKGVEVMTSSSSPNTTQTILQSTLNSNTNEQNKDSQRGEENENQPWWSKGKTVPLLSDFDNDRRSFYLSQAGLATSSNTNALDQHKHSHFGSVIVERPLGLQQNNQSFHLHQPSSTTIVTPGKKTWNAVWGQDGQRSVTNSDKKRKSASTKAATVTTPSRSTTSSRGTGGGGNKISRRGPRKTT